MITKIIACADVHIPNLNGMDELKGVLDEFIEASKKIVEENGKDSVRIVIVGDVFHSKINTSNESMILASWFFSELDKICKTFVIAGNHDMLMNNMDRVDSLTPIFEMGDYKNVIYLDKELGYKSGTYVDDNVVWCLYSSFSGFSTPDIEATKITNSEDKYAYVGLIHADINGSVSPTNYITERGVDPSVFTGLNLCIAGHIHRFQEIKKNGVKVVYCSSMKQQDYGETVSGHGFVLWDIEDYEFPEYELVELENKLGGHYKFEVNSIDDVENDLEQLINV